MFRVVGNFGQPRKINYSNQKQLKNHKHQLNKKQKKETITKKPKWKEKQMYGYFKQQTSETSHEKTMDTVKSRKP